MRRFFLFLFVCGSRATGIAQPSLPNLVGIPEGASQAQIIERAAHVRPSVRQLRWQQLELTAFLHFGINTFTNREWGDGKESPDLFNPQKFDAEQWIRTCKEAGFKQVILTAKHHDGFCLWPSKYTSHSVKSSPWRNGRGDVVREVAAACRKYGVGFGVYLSPWDRHSPLYGDSAAYNRYFMNQLTELLTGYGRIDEVWFDGANGEGRNGKKQVYAFEQWYRLIRRLQPGAVIGVMGPDVRWVGTETGYGRETEWSVLPLDMQDPSQVAKGSQTDVAFVPSGDRTGEDLGSRSRIATARALVWYPAETDVSIRPGWFYHPLENEKVKSAETLMDIYRHSVGRNGVLLLNIPPTTEGLIHARDSAVLMEFKRLRAQLFSNNLLKGAALSAGKGRPVKSLLDNRFNTYLEAKGQDSTLVLEARWDTPRRFNVLMLQEYIAVGQRVEGFVLEAFDGQGWKQVTSGTTIGYKRIIEFPAVSTKAVRLRILSSRATPVLSEIGLYTK